MGAIHPQNFKFKNLGSGLTVSSLSGRDGSKCPLQRWGIQQGSVTPEKWQNPASYEGRGMKNNRQLPFQRATKSDVISQLLEAEVLTKGEGDLSKSQDLPDRYVRGNSIHTIKLYSAPPPRKAAQL